MRKFKLKQLTILLLGLMLAFLVACSGNNESDSSNANNVSDNNEAENTNENSSGELTGEIEFMTLSLFPTFEEYLNDLKDAFEAEHPGVTVTINDIPFDQVEQIISTQAAGGQLPDVMNLNTDFVKSIAANGALVNMDEAAADVKDTFFDGLWETGLVNGAVYALPWYTTTSGLMYNPDILAEAGFDSPPSTYEEAWEMSAVIYEKTGAYGEVITPEMHLLFPKNDIPILNEDLTVAAFNTPEAAELWEGFKEAHDAGLYELDVMLNQIAMPELYAQEQIAWWATGPQLFRQVRDLSPEVYEKSLAAPALVGEAGAQHANPMNITVAESSESKEAAIAFAKFVTNAENQLAFAKEASVLPPVAEAVEDAFFEEYSDSEDATERGTFYAAQSLEEAYNMTPAVENVTQIYDIIQEAFQMVILQDMDVSEALDLAETEVNSILK